MSRAAEYFTEYFSGGDFDLLGLSLTFTPDGSEDYYSADAQLISELPVDASGHGIVPLPDDGSQIVSFSGDGRKNFTFYGVLYYGSYVGSNGYLTFSAGDNSHSPSINNHFSTPRISTYYDDWDPSSGGPIRIGYLNDRFVVTFDGVWEYGTNPSSGTFQTELFYDDGSIRMSWMNLDPSSALGIVGLSNGEGQPGDYSESDLSTFAFDLDQDGIWDEWEKDFFGHRSNCVATAHSDGDEQDNYSEYICGSDPFDSSSYFYCTNSDSSTEMVIMWPVIEGRTYRVLKSENLAIEAFLPLAAGIEYPINAYTDTLSSATACYRVEVELAE